MRDRDIARAGQLEAALIQFGQDVQALPGINAIENRMMLIEQFLDSIRRVQYVHVIREMPHDPRRAIPSSELFDPLKAAAIHRLNGDIEEASWLVFLATHFGKNHRTGWRLLRDVYRGDGARSIWTWRRVSQDPDALRN